MTDFIDNTTIPKSTKSRIPNVSVQIQMKPNSQLKIVPQDTEETERKLIVMIWWISKMSYGVAMISRLLKIIGLFGRISSVS